MSLLWTVVLCGLAVLLGSIVQGSIGLGMALVASPFVTIIDPTLMPGSLMLISSLLPIATLIKERDQIDWRGLAWAFPGRFVGTALGAWLVVVASVTTLSVVIALVVLAAAALSVVRWKPQPTSANLLIASTISGIGATATSVGGPPIALVYQHQPPAVLRCTLAVYFLVGNLVSLATLLAVGHLSARQSLFGLIFIPFLIVGFAISLLLRRRLDVGKTRSLVLVISAVSSVVLLVRAAL